MNLPLDFNSAEPGTRIVKIAVTIAAVYVIAVVGMVESPIAPLHP